MANSTQVDFLDVTLNLENCTFRPFIKPGDKPLYVHSKSNHPPSIIKNIPKGINKRLSKISSTKEIFDQASPAYQQELDRNGYNHTLVYDPSETNKKRKRCRNKRKIYFNPPYSLNVKTNIGAKFLNLIDQCFSIGHPLQPLLNRKSVKISYRCLPNMGNLIANHNSKTLNSLGTQALDKPGCNCTTQECPMPGECLTPSIVYQATVTENTETKNVETYIGLTNDPFKVRFENHKSSFKHQHRSKASELSKHIWRLKERGTTFTINWKIIEKVKAFSPVTGQCKLCLREKYLILTKPHLGTLNNRDEILSACRHKQVKLLARPG